MKAMILAAGYGTRLRPLTFSLPKPMVAICNRPLIGYAVESFIRFGVREIVVNLHHLPQAIERYLTHHYGAQCQFHFSHEAEILGTGGGVRKVRSLLEGGDFFLVNGDTIQVPPYERLIEAREREDALAALTLRHPPEGDRFTAVWSDDGHINGFGKGTGEALMFSGSHFISSRLFQYLPDREFSGIVNEVYKPLLEQKKEKIAAVVDERPWFDIGTPRRYISAARGVLELTIAGDLPVVSGSRVSRDSIIDNTSTVLGDVSHSSIGARSAVRGEVRDSIIGTDCRINGSASLHSCIVADEVEINRPIELRNAIICRDDAGAPRDGTYRYEDGLVIAEF